MKDSKTSRSISGICKYGSIACQTRTNKSGRHLQVTSGLLWPWKLGCLSYKVFLLWLTTCPEKPWGGHLEKGILVLDGVTFIFLFPTHLILFFVCLFYFYSILCKRKIMWHRLHYYVISFLVIDNSVFISGARL